MRHLLTLFSCCLLIAACDTSGSPTGPDAGAGGEPDLVSVEELTPLVDAGEDVALDAGVDVPAEPVDVVADAGEDTAEPIPYPARELPFVFERPADGEPIPADEVTAFTESVTGLWKQVDWFRWVLRTSYGVDASTGYDDYLAWHNDVFAVKEDGLVTFLQNGREHNMWIPGSKVLSQLINGYLLTGDPVMAKGAEQYCKGLSAVVKGFVWDENDPAPYLMARAVLPMDQEFVMDEENWLDDGRRKAVNFTRAYEDEVGWNAESFAWPHNPTWGSIWVTNMRSKDDVCAITRSTTWLAYAAIDAPDEFVREACAETLELMQGFNKDIVDHDYQIRTKGRDGVAVLVEGQDLGNYTDYMGIDPRSECTARLASDLIAYGERRTNDCGDGYGGAYEEVATATHHYNYPIVWDYHMAALGNALVHGQIADALPLLEGMAARMDRYLDPDGDEPGATHSHWGMEMAIVLVKAASMGLPLTANEARLVQQHWTQAVVEFGAFERWDLWDESVPDGQYSKGEFRPERSSDGIEIESLALLVEYCNSPFKNPAGAAFVDCEIVADTARWGGGE